MGSEPLDARWPKLISLAVHELRTPITVVSGYIRMLLKDRAGPLSDQQRKLLEEAEKSCGRLSALVAEMSELASLESKGAAFNRGTVDLEALIMEAIVALPPLPDRDVTVELRTNGATPPYNADAKKLREAMTALLLALRREVVASDRLIVQLGTRSGDSQRASVVAIGEADQVDAIAGAELSSLERFDEWRGGSGLSLAIARRIIGQHGGTVHDPPGGGKAGALVVLPQE